MQGSWRMGQPDYTDFAGSLRRRCRPIGGGGPTHSQPLRSTNFNITLNTYTANSKSLLCPHYSLHPRRSPFRHNDPPRIGRCMTRTGSWLQTTRPHAIWSNTNRRPSHARHGPFSHTVTLNRHSVQSATAGAIPFGSRISFLSHITVARQLCETPLFRTVVAWRRPIRKQSICRKPHNRKSLNMPQSGRKLPDYSLQKALSRGLTNPLHERMFRCARF